MNHSFSITARVWEAVPLEKGVLIHSLTDLLNTELSLSDYGQGLEEFNFTALLEPEAFFPDKHRYLEAEKRLDAEVHLDYERALNASIDDFKAMVAQLYLDTIHLLQQETVLDFDWERFKRDLEELFEREGWVMHRV